MSNRTWTHFKCVLWTGGLCVWPPPRICLTQRGLTVSAQHLYIILPSSFSLLRKKKKKKKTLCWLTAALQRSAFMILTCCWGLRGGERPRLRQPVMLWGQFRWLALKCKLKRVSLCSLKWPVLGNIMKNYPQPVCVVSNVVTGRNC